MINEKKLFEIYFSTTFFSAYKQIASFDQLYKNYDLFLNEHLDDDIQKEVNKINNSGVEKFTDEEVKSLTDDLSQHYGLSFQAKELLTNYMIVATWSIYEKASKQLLALTEKLTPNQIDNCYKKTEVIKLLKAKFNIDFTLLVNYQEIEELRCLNNAIKHKGLVSKELNNANSKWIINSPIGNTYNDFLRLMNAPYKLYDYP
jgi:uncharacterized coiled-coil protein SlyX